MKNALDQTPKHCATSGELYLVTTPIGNLEDITYRAVRVLGEVDLIAAEDTRRARILLEHFDIKTKTISYHSHNEHRKTDGLLDQVENGVKIAMLSDAGTPAVADPGFLLAREAMNRGIRPIIIPGVSSLTFAITASGLPVDKFVFHGFPHVKKGRRERLLQEIAEEEKTVILFESIHRIAKLLNELREFAGDDRIVAVIREATKVHEEVIRGTLKEVTEATADKNWKGECVVVVAKKGFES